MNILHKIKISNKSADIIRITVGSILFAISIKFFYGPYNLIIGGVVGIGSIIEYISNNLGFKIPIFFTNIVLNAPLVILGYKFKGKKFINKTVFSIIILTISFAILEYVPNFEIDLFLSTVFGGIVEGIGLGLVITSFATTGGTSLAATLVQLFLKHINIAWILFFIDSIIIGIGFFLFGLEKTMYSILAVYIAMKTVEIITEGIHFAKAVFIISNKSKEISSNIMEKLHRGITSFKARGIYTSKDKEVLLCVIDKKEIIKMKSIVKEQDKNAFVFVTNVNEVLGEGFVSKDKEEL